MLISIDFAGKVSKFRHLKGTPGHKSSHIENIRNISRQIPGECNGFHGNKNSVFQRRETLLTFTLGNHKRVAVPISGPGGKIAVYELSKPGRLPDGVIPSLVNGSNIMDFQWDPFDSSMLAGTNRFRISSKIRRSFVVMYKSLNFQLLAMMALSRCGTFPTKD